MATTRGIVLLLVLAFAAGCFLFTPPPPIFDDIAARAVPATTLPASPSPLRAAMLGGEGPTYALVRTLPWGPGELAAVQGGLPTVTGWTGRPIAGESWSITWGIRATPAYAEGVPTWLPLYDGNHDGVKEPVQLRCVLAVSQRPLERSAAIPGGEGGRLAVNLDSILQPARASLHSQFFTLDQQGRVAIDITFPETWVGQHFYLQLLVEDWRVPAYLTVSQAVELIVGDA